MKIIIYDFDGTLTPYPIPKLEILEKCGINKGLNNKDFLNKINNYSKKNNIDNYTALYQLLIKILKDKNIKLTDKNICIGINKIEYNKGLIEYLEFTKNYNIKNYIISSGIKEYLKNTEIAKYFNDIYASTFIYENNSIKDIEYIMNDKNKVDAIKDIIKINKIDIKNIIYIGDGLSDYYAFKYIYNNKGTTILLNNNADEKLKEVSSLITIPDYSYNSNLFNYICKICNIHN